MDINSGAKLGPYEILSSLGKGGMGEVWRARDPRLNREVAIKISAMQFTDRFEKEARAIAALNHPNICTLHDIGPNYLVMELIEGPTLADRIAEGAIPIEEALAIAKQIADGLEAAHEKNIVHRDLKPGNIKIRPDGSVKVLDFGLAKATGPETTVTSDSPTMMQTPTQIGVILGTAAYMAPEQARGKTVDKRADIWAFGVVLHEMVTGQRLFEGETISDTLASVLKEAPDWTKVPARVQRVLKRCLEKDPRKRLRDISGVELLLEEAEKTVAPTLPPAPDSSGDTTRRSRFAWIAAGVLAVTTAGLAAFLLSHRSNTAPLETMRFEVAAPQDTTFEVSVSISPDGRTIAFPAISTVDSRTRLWVRATDSLDAHPLAGTEGMLAGSAPFWLPDSRTLVFSMNGKLRKIDATGGPPQSICDFNFIVGSGFLTPDNKIAFGTPATQGIQACPAGGGSPVPVTAFKPGGQESFHAFPSLLPDGKHFLFGRSAGPDTGIYAGSLDAKPEQQTGKRVLPDTFGSRYVAGPDGSGYILFVRDGTLMAQAFDTKQLEVTGGAFPVGTDVLTSYSFWASSLSPTGDGKLVYLTGAGNVQPTWVDRQGKAMGTAGNASRTLAGMRISPDGTRLAASRSEPGAKSDIWVVNLAQGSETRLTTNPANDSNPVWSPDGSRIVFSSDREGAQNLYIRAADGAGSDELLLKTGERKYPLDWSRDGKFLLYFSLGEKTGRDVWALPMDGGEKKPVPYLRTAANENNARFSPDGRFVAYQSDESGVNEVYVRPFDAASPEVSGSGAGKVKVSSNGGTFPSWRSDGKELYFFTPDQKWWAVDVTNAASFRAGTPRPLGQLPRGARAVTPDGQRALVGVPVGAQSSMTLVVNWLAALKK